jgi:MtN3 and saliva related transmembrane protein
MQPSDVVGWTASLVLLATLAAQILKQAKSASVAGVSPWLFVGQSTASLGFLIYAWLLDNSVFIFTNVLALLAALVGQYIWWRKSNQRTSTTTTLS